MDMPMKDPDPRKLTYGAPPPTSKLVIVRITKETKEDKLGCYLEAFKSEMEQKRPVLVRDTADGMLAKAAGIRANDVIYSINGHEVETPAGSKELFLRAPLKRPFEVVLWRPPPRKPYVTQHEPWMIACGAVGAYIVSYLQDAPEDLTSRAALLLILVLVACVVGVGVLYYGRLHRDAKEEELQAFAELESADGHPAAIKEEPRVITSEQERAADSRTPSPTSVVADKRPPSSKEDYKEGAAAVADSRPTKAAHTPLVAGNLTVLRSLTVSAERQLGKNDPNTIKAADALLQALDQAGEAEEAANVRARFGFNLP